MARRRERRLILLIRSSRDNYGHSDDIDTPRMKDEMV